MSAEDIDLALVNDALTERVQRETTSVQTEWTGRVTSKDLEGVYYVDITGGATAMPCVRSLVDVRIGQIVDVRIQNGHAVITGCRSDPVATSSSVNVVEKKVTTVRNEVQIIRTEKADVTELNAVRANVEELHAQYGEFETVVTQDLLAANADITNLKAKDAEITGQLTAVNGEITNLKAKDVTIEGNLSAATGRIDTLESDNVTVNGRLDAAEADIDDLEAEDARIGNLVAGKADITDLTAATGRITTLESTKADISTLESDYITAAVIEAQYMHANMSNSDVAWIQNGVIKDGAISSAMINTLSANKIVGGTADFSKINVVNLKAENIEVDKINGQTVTGKSVVDALTQHESDISDLDSKLDDAVDDLQDQIDGAIETWTGTEVPTLLNTPASAWTTDDDRRKHVGDVYFVVNSNSQQNGYNYRFTKSGSTYSWQLIKDSDVTAALSRLDAAEGKITTFDSDISTLKTETGTLTTKTTSLETRMSDAESDILDKVDTTTFNEVSDTVDSHSQSISQMTETLSNKADGSTVTALTNRVSTTEQDISGINTTIGELQTTVASKADGSTVETISSQLNTVSDTVDGHTQTISSVQGIANNANNKAVAYSATSSTGSTTAAKVAACTNFPALAAGVTVTVRFSNASTATGALTLNVNSTGAKTIYVNGSATSSTNQLLWAANANVTFTYDGTYWRVDSEPRSWYGTCSIAAATAAKTSAISEAVVCKGTNVTLNMTYENTSTSATLNVASTGAKNIYYGTTTTRPTTSNGYGWTAASTVTFVFDGAYWRLGDTSALAGLASVKSTVTEHTTSIQQNAEAIQTKASASDLDALTGRVTTAESTITQQAGQIDAKVSKDGVIAAINLSTETSGGSTAKISADKVNIEGAAIFTSGRLSQSSLNSAYDAAGSASAAQAAAISAAAADATSKANAAQTAATNAANTATDNKLTSYSKKIEYIYNNNGVGYGYAKLCNIAIRSSYRNLPVSFTVRRRGVQETHATWQFANNNDPTAAVVSRATYDSNWPLYYVSLESGAYDIYVKLGEAWDQVEVTDFRNPYTDGGIVVTWAGEYYGTEPPEDAVEFTRLIGGETKASYDTAIANAQNTANNAAPKTSAVAETQRVYYRSKVSGTVTSPGTAWVTASGDIWNDTVTVGVNGWSTKVTPMSKDKASNTDANKYLYLYTAIQKKTVSGSVTTTTVLLDDSTTIIDGGNIITGSVTANQLSANSVTADKIAANAITVGKMPSADQASILNSNVQVGGRNLLLDSEKDTTSGATSYPTAVYSFVPDFDLVEGEQYTVRIWGQNSGRIGLCPYIGGGNQQIGSWQSIEGVTDVDVSWTFSARAGDVSAANTVHVYSSMDVGTNGTRDLTTTSFTVTRIKLEHGNKPTDWTPALEDVDASISEVESGLTENIGSVSEDAENTANLLQALTDGLSQTNTFSIDEETGEVTFDLDSAMQGLQTESAEGISAAKKELTDRMNARDEEVDAAIEEAAKANLYLHFDEKSDGLEIGKNLGGTAGAFRQLMDDQGTHWQYNREDAAYVGVSDEGLGTMFLDEAQVTGRFRIGNYVFLANDDGTRMSLKWIGE